MPSLVKQRKKPNAILRKLQQPLYDTNVIDDAGGFNLMQFFLLPVGQPMPVAGGNKSEVDTNMTQASQLGTPEEFSLKGFQFEYFHEDPSNIIDFANDQFAMYDESVFTFFFSNNRPWLQVPLSRIPSGTMLTGTGSSGDTTGTVEFGFVHQGEASVKEYYDFKIEKKGIHIHTNEPFFVELTWPNGNPTWATDDEDRVRVYLVGHLFAAL